MGFMSFLGAAERQVNPFDNGKTAKNPQGNGQNNSTASQVKNLGWNFLNKTVVQPAQQTIHSVATSPAASVAKIGVADITGNNIARQNATHQLDATLNGPKIPITINNNGKTIPNPAATKIVLGAANGVGEAGPVKGVPEEVPNASNKLAQTIHQDTVNNGGVSLNLKGATPPKASIVYSPSKSTETVIAPKDFTPAAVDAFKQKYAAELQKPNNYLGTYTDSKGNYVLDVSTAAPHTPEAIKAAHASQQISVWDNLHNQEIQTGQINKNGIYSAHDTPTNLFAQSHQEPGGTPPRNSGGTPEVPQNVHPASSQAQNQTSLVPPLVSPDQVIQLVKASTPKEVRGILGNSLPSHIVDRLTPSIINTKDPNIIHNLIDNAAKPRVDTSIAPPITPPPPSPEAGHAALTDLANKSTSFQDFEKQFTALPNHPDLQAAVEQASQQHGTLEEYYNSLKPNTASQQVINSLKEANSTRAQQEAGYAEERSRRIGAATQAGKDQAGTQGYYSELSQLKGELPKEAYVGLSDKLNPKQQEDLFSQLRDQVKQTNQGYSSINAQTALHKVIFGNEGVPTNSEIKLLQNTFGDDFANAVKEDVASHNQKISTLKSVGNKVAEIAGVPRAIMASTDFSGGLRQGLAAATRHPIVFAKAFAGQFGDFFSEKAYQQSQAAIENHPNFPLMQRAKLAIQDVGSKVPNEHEEQFVSQLAERIPGIGRLVRASDRAYTGILSNMRANIFNQLVETAKNAGHDFEQPESQKLLKDIGTVVNTGTGRGNLGMFESASHALSTALFAPRLIASRLSMLDPRYYINLEPIARKEALTTLASLGAMATTILSLAELSGAKVNTDPTNADFGKIKVGDTRFDILGGYQQYLRLGAQLKTGRTTSSLTGHSQTLGKGIAATRWDVLTRFLTNKEAPVPSFVTTALRGKDNAGNPIDYKHEVLSRFTPLLTQDIHDLMTHPNSPGPVAGVAGALGVGLQTYGPQDTTPTPKQTAYIKSIKDPAQAQATKQLFQVLKTAPAKADAKGAIVSAMQKGDTNKVIELAKQFNSKYDATANDWFKTNEKYYQQDPNLVKEYRSGYITESTLNSWDKAIQDAKKGPSL